MNVKIEFGYEIVQMDFKKKNQTLHVDKCNDKKKMTVSHSRVLTTEQIFKMIKNILQYFQQKPKHTQHKIGRAHV